MKRSCNVISRRDANVHKKVTQNEDRTRKVIVSLFHT